MSDTKETDEMEMNCFQCDAIYHTTNEKRLLCSTCLTVKGYLERITRLIAYVADIYDY